MRRYLIFILLLPCSVSAQFIFNNTDGNQGAVCDSAAVSTTFGSNFDGLGIWSQITTSGSIPNGDDADPTLIADGLQYTSNGGGSAEGIEATVDMVAACADSVTVTATAWTGGGERLQFYYSTNGGSSWTQVFNESGADHPSGSYSADLSAVENETDVVFRFFMTTFQNQGITTNEIRFH